MTSNILIDRRFILCYKSVAFIALLLLSSMAFAADSFATLLPNKAVSIGNNVYEIKNYSYTKTDKKIKQKLGSEETTISDVLVNEKDYRIYVFYNLKSFARWHRIFVIEEGKKLTIRIFE